MPKKENGGWGKTAAVILIAMALIVFVGAVYIGSESRSSPSSPLHPFQLVLESIRGNIPLFGDNAQYHYLLADKRIEEIASNNKLNKTSDDAFTLLNQEAYLIIIKDDTTYHNFLVDVASNVNEITNAQLQFPQDYQNIRTAVIVSQAYQIQMEAMNKTGVPTAISQSYYSSLSANDKLSVSQDRALLNDWLKSHGWSDAYMVVYK